MILKKGQTVTAAILNSIFKTLKRKANEVSSSQIKVLTTGQVIDTSVYAGNTFINTPMSSTNEQYFDTTFVPGYYVGVDADIYRGNNSYLYYYIDEINKIDQIGV